MMDWLRSLLKVHSPSKEWTRIISYENKDEYKIFRGLRRENKNNEDR